MEPWRWQLPERLKNLVPSHIKKVYPKFRNLAIGNRIYIDKTRLRGLKTFLVRGGGHCLCRREFYIIKSAILILNW
jgi:hypothetical protein